MRLFRFLVLVGTVAVVAGPVHAGSVQQASSLKKISIESLQEGAFTATGRSLCAAGQGVVLRSLPSHGPTLTEASTSSS